MNMNNPMFANTLNNMNPEMIRNMSKMVEGMSDDQLKQMISRSGMGNIDPQFYRQQLKFMNSMSDKDIENMKNMSKNNFSNGNNNCNQSNNNVNQNQNQNQNKKQNSTEDILNSINETEYNKLVSIKNQGNELFKQGKYSNANEKYFEILNKITNLKQNKNDNASYEELEISSRLNIAMCYINLKEYLLTVNECKKVLKIDPNNFKALYRCGIGYFNMNENELANVFFENSLKFKDISKTDEENVKNYLNKIKEINAINNNKSSIDNNILNNSSKDNGYNDTNKNKDFNNIQENKKNINDILKNELRTSIKENKDNFKSDELSDIKVENIENVNKRENEINNNLNFNSSINPNVNINEVKNNISNMVRIKQ